MTPEGRLAQTVRDYLNVALPVAATWCHVPNELGHGKTPVGFRPGWPDITIVHKGKAFFIELKRPDWHDGRRKRSVNLSSNQRIVRDQLVKAGSPYAMVKSIEQLQGTLKGWGLS